MTNIELALTNLGEAAAVEIHKSNESVGMDDLKNDVIDAGGVMKKAKDELEDKIKKSVVSNKNYLDLTDKINENFIVKKRNYIVPFFSYYFEVLIK